MCSEIVIVRGGGDIATGVIQKLHHCGFRVLSLEVEKPTAIRRKVSLCEAVYKQEMTVENITAVLAHNQNDIERAWEKNIIPVVVDAQGDWIKQLKPDIVVDAILAKKNIGTHQLMAPITIALGPGFEAGVDVDIVIETMRGHHLGRLITSGFAKENTGVPGEIGGVSKERVLYSPKSGVFNQKKLIGDLVNEGEVIASVDGEEIKATITGTLRGIIRDGFVVTKGLKIADIDPRQIDVKNCFTISDKARAIGGAVLEAIFMLKKTRIRRNKMEDEIMLKIYESLHRGERVAMAVITEELGSSPRKSGSIMAVWESGETLGSVGGGKIELTVIGQSMDCIKKGEDIHFNYKLSDIGMECGGLVKGYVKIFKPKTKLVIVGGGHIGIKLFQLAKVLNFHTVIIDDRQEFANESRFMGANEIFHGDIATTLENYPLSKNDYVAIVTKGQATDQAALAAVINRDLAYIGMIGSTKKVRLVMQALMDSGLEKEALKKVYAPMGLDFKSNNPEDIAFSIISEIMLIKSKGTLNHLSKLKKVWD